MLAPAGLQDTQEDWQRQCDEAAARQGALPLVAAFAAVFACYSGHLDTDERIKRHQSLVAEVRFQLLKHVKHPTPVGNLSHIADIGK